MREVTPGAGRLRSVAPPKTQGDEGKRRKLVFLDGHSLAFRAFFALPDTLVTSSGQLTNAAYGFTSMLIKLLGDERPDGVAVCFDKGKPEFRYERYEEYKAGRAETPDEFSQQLPLIREVLEALKIPILELEGYEADDLLATLAKRGTEEGDDVVVVTGDRDCLQLAGDHVTVMMTRRGISDIGRYDPEAVHEKYGVTPEQWTDFVALKGESSDNLPGIPGVGDKTAAKLVNEYGDIEGVIAHADDLTPKVSKGVKELAEQVRINKELGRLLDDVPLDVDPADIHVEPWDDEEVRKLFGSLEFRTLYERLQELNLTETAAVPTISLESLSELGVDEAPPTGDLVAVAWDGAWLALCAEPGEARILPVEAATSRLADLLADPDAAKVAHDAKPLYRMALEGDRDLRGFACDTEIAAYLLEPGAAAGYKLADACRRYLGVSLEEDEEAAGADQGTLDLDHGERAAREAVAVRALAPILIDHLRNRGMWELAETLEFPLVGVLARMEHAGVLIDRDYLEELDRDLGKKMEVLEGRIHEHAGEVFNVNSHPQLQEVLFTKLELPKTRKIKTGYSTDAAELAKLHDEHPIVEALLEYREVAKLKTGFTDTLLPLIDPKTKRIHTTYGQAAAATGRLASSEPNVQNIPIRGELGRQIRRAFVAPTGKLLLSADYSQIELRVLAHLSEDPSFLEAFSQEHDFHAATAAKVYGVEVDDVTPQMRGYVKQFSYGIAYGMSAYGVSQRLGIEMDEAGEFIEAYYAQFPKVRAFLTEQVEKAKVDGFTTTMFGRRRYLPELGSRNYRLRALGERMALNAPIQGSAADIIKRAMIDIDAALRQEPELGTMLLTVHDELVFEVPEDVAERSAGLVRTKMEGAADLRVELAVEIHTGPNWADAHA